MALSKKCPVCGLVNPESARSCDCGYLFGRGASIRKPDGIPLLSWLICGGIFLLGCLVLGIGVFSFFHGTTPEDELTLAEGVPSDIDMTLVTGRYGHRHYTLHFTIAGYRTEYGSDSPHFQDVVTAVSSGDPIQAWISTKRETVFERQGWVPLYKLSGNGEPVITYSEVVGDSSSKSTSVFIGGGFLFVLGLVGLLICWRKARQAAVLSGTE